MSIEPRNILISFSLALYSQWFYHKPTRCLFDAGEGVATIMGKKVFGIRHIFLTHGHEDHIAGISNLVNIRNLASGDFAKPLTIYYPRHDYWISALLEYIEKKQSGLLRYPLYVQPLGVGDSVELEGARRPTRVNAFEMKHMVGQISLGYEIEEERKVIDGTTGESVYRYHPIFLYTGDGYEVVYSPYGRVDLAIHEATFMGCDANRACAWETSRHSTVDMALDWAASQDVKALILCHISDRYSIDEIIKSAVIAKKEFHYRGELFVAYREKIIPISEFGSME